MMTVRAEDTTAEESAWSKLRRAARLYDKSYRRLLALAAGEWRLLTGATVFLCIGSLAGLAMPKAVGILLDDAMRHGVDSPLIRIMLGLCLLQGVAVSLRFYMFTLAGQRIVSKLRAQVYEHIIGQDIGFFDQRKTGELLSRLTSDTQVLQATVTVNTSMVLRNLALAAGSLAMLCYISPLLTGLMLLVVPALVIAILVTARPLRLLSRRVQDAIARASEIAAETLSGIRTVRSFGREGREAERFGGAILESFTAMRTRSRFMAYFQGGVSFAGYAAVALVLWYGCQLVVQGEMSIGQLTSFMMYTVVLAFALGTLGSVFTEFVSAAGAAERLFQLLDTEPAVALQGGQVPESIRGRICFEEVSFRYPTRPEALALERVNFTIEPGEVVALVGPSGSGKSTVAALLCRFYEPSSGRITLDGMPMRELDPTWLRRRIGVVSQEPILFSTSILANIGYGLDSFDEADIVRAATLANAHEFITSFADGYLTQVGERGVRLSGGQKQRVAIARAILKDPEILILDEATSALDAESEHLVKQALDRLMAGRTSIVIAHRLSTVKDADRVLVLDRGQIVESGSHAQLMARVGGIYRQLVERQVLAHPYLQLNPSLEGGE